MVEDHSQLVAGWAADSNSATKEMSVTNPATKEMEVSAHLGSDPKET